MPIYSHHFLPWLGVLASLLGLVIFGVLFLCAGYLHVPWYAVALSLLGLALTSFALRQHRTPGRIAAFVLVALLTTVEVWFLLFFIPNPAYAGPLVAGQPVPAFSIRHSNGQPFTHLDLSGDRHTVLVFYRGHW